MLAVIVLMVRLLELHMFLKSPGQNPTVQNLPGHNPTTENTTVQ